MKVVSEWLNFEENTATVKSHIWVHGVQVPLIAVVISRLEIIVPKNFEDIIPLSSSFQSSWGEVRSHPDSRSFINDFVFPSLEAFGTFCESSGLRSSMMTCLGVAPFSSFVLDTW